jgi:hypothetical protein
MIGWTVRHFAHAGFARGEITQSCWAGANRRLRPRAKVNAQTQWDVAGRRIELQDNPPVQIFPI